MRAEMVQWMLCCLLVAGAARRIEAQSAPRLLEQAVARGAWLHLSDLLPAGTSPELMTEARAIELGRLPQPGNFRVLRRDELTKAIGRVRVSVPEQVIVHSWGWPASTKRLEEALAAVGLNAGDLSSLAWPQEHLLRTAAAPLRVTAVRPATGTRLQIRFERRTRADCAPFWGEIEGKFNAEMTRRLLHAM